jgi:hypothetical protein
MATRFVVGGLTALTLATQAALQTVNGHFTLGG